MDVRIFETVGEAHAAALAELVNEVGTVPAPLVCFATGSTFAAFYPAIAAAVAAGRLDLGRAIVTHLDEYLDHAPTSPHGMVHEIVSGCPPLAALLERGRFWPVPNSGAAAELRAHEARLSAAGEIGLMFLGIGRNGHIAFNEPGTAFELGFHRTALATTTREDSRPRFAPAEPPHEAVTAGPKTILRARRIVLVATGARKAQAIRAMLEGPIEIGCPASVLRLHERVTVLLDRAAASALPVPGNQQSRGAAHGR